MDGAAHNGLGPPAEVIIKGIFPHTCPQANLILAIPKPRLSCQMTVGCGKSAKLSRTHPYGEDISVLSHRKADNTQGASVWLEFS